MSIATPDKKPGEFDVFDAVHEYLTASEYLFASNADKDTISLSFSGEVFEIRVIIFCSDGFLVIHACLPFTIKAESLELAAHLNKLNSNTPVGNFEYNVHREVIAFRVGFHCPPIPSLEVFEQELSNAITEIDDESQAIFALLPKPSPRSAVTDK